MEPISITFNLIRAIPAIPTSSIVSRSLLGEFNLEDAVSPRMNVVSRYAIHKHRNSNVTSNVEERVMVKMHVRRSHLAVMIVEMRL